MIDSIRSVSSSHLEQSMDIQTASSPVSKGIARRFSSLEIFEERNNVYSGTGGFEKIKEIFDSIFSEMLKCFEKIKAVFIPKKEENTPLPEERNLEPGGDSPLQPLVGLLAIQGTSRDAVVRSFHSLQPVIQSQIKEKMIGYIYSDFVEALVTPCKNLYKELQENEINQELLIIQKSFEGRIGEAIEGLEESVQSAVAGERVRDVFSRRSLFRKALNEMDDPRNSGGRESVLELLNRNESVSHEDLFRCLNEKDLVLSISLEMARNLFLLNTIAKADRLVKGWITDQVIECIITGENVPSLNMEGLEVLFPSKQVNSRYYEGVSQEYRLVLQEFSPQAISEHLLNQEGPGSCFVRAVNARHDELA